MTTVVADGFPPVPQAPSEPGALEASLHAARSAGRKLVVPYVTGGFGDDWLDVVRAVAAAGADAVEVGIPFSDPVMDGPVIQQASTVALASGTTPSKILAELSGADAGVPLAVMTYYNLVHRPGPARFADDLAAAGVSAAILPDLPLDEVGPWATEADRAGVETVLLVAPTTPDERAAAICARSRGFVYSVGLMGVTGVRSELAATARETARRVTALTDKPVLVGVGVSTPEQAVEVCQDADGVVVGSALMRRLLDGGGASAAADLVASLRSALDAG